MKGKLDQILRAGYQDLIADARETSGPGRALEDLHSRIRADPLIEQAAPPSLDHWIAVRYARRPEETQISTARRHPERSEADLICEVIEEVITVLLAGETRQHAAAWLSPIGGPYLSAAARYLAQLHAGIAGRTIDRDDAHRLVRLTEHNLAEAVQLISAERAAVRRRRERDVLNGLAADAGESARAIRALHPRILRLFDDSRDQAHLVPVPQNPV